MAPERFPRPSQAASVRHRWQRLRALSAPLPWPLPLLPCRAEDVDAPYHTLAGLLVLILADHRLHSPDRRPLLSPGSSPPRAPYFMGRNAPTCAVSTARTRTASRIPCHLFIPALNGPRSISCFSWGPRPECPMYGRIHQAWGDVAFRLAGLESGECLLHHGVDLHLNFSPRVVGQRIERVLRPLMHSIAGAAARPAGPPSFVAPPLPRPPADAGARGTSLRFPQALGRSCAFRACSW